MKRGEAEIVGKSASYWGVHSRVVDNGRIILPLEWRAKTAPKKFTIIFWPLVDCEYMLVLPPVRWEEMKRKLQATLLADENAARVERLLSVRSSERLMDTYGRLPLPEEAANILGIKDKAVVIGRHDKFEIWAPDKLKLQTDQPDKQLINETLKLMQI